MPFDSIILNIVCSFPAERAGITLIVEHPAFYLFDSLGTSTAGTPHRR